MKQIYTIHFLQLCTAGQIILASFLFINLTIGIVSITGWLKSSIKIIVIANHITTRNPKRFGR